MSNKQTVFVGLSGGVDSSVAALRLRAQGYTVVGVFIRVWQPDFLDCNWEAERLDAMRVAAQLHIPFLTCDGVQAYKDGVADYFISEYKAGRTPNPDVMCNKVVKFGVFLDFAKKHNADYIATGHYAQNLAKDGQYQLMRGVDQEKDQSYFLWTLNQAQLQYILLPVGDSPKKVIRAEADDAELITADKKDSQGICFLGHVDIPEFLSHYVELKTGDVLHTNGTVIGSHSGALVYTTGQRHGFTVFEQDTARSKYYVESRDLEANTITVSDTKPVHEVGSHITLTDCNWITNQPQVGALFTFQTRYRQTPVPCTLETISNNTATLSASIATELSASGQSCVLYDGSLCMGGGIIS